MNLTVGPIHIRIKFGFIPYIGGRLLSGLIFLKMAHNMEFHPFSLGFSMSNLHETLSYSTDLGPSYRIHKNLIFKYMGNAPM